MIMKNKIFKTVIFLILSCCVYNDLSAKVYYEYEKIGGKFVFNWFKSYIGFDTVYQEESIHSGNIVKHVTCLGKGLNRCKPHVGHVSNLNLISVSEENSFSETFIDTINSELLDDVEDLIVSKKEFQGTLSKKIQAVSNEGNTCILSFFVQWFNCEEDNKGRIIISVDELKI